MLWVAGLIGNNSHICLELRKISESFFLLLIIDVLLLVTGTERI
jgi:hypothetical protein